MFGNRVNRLVANQALEDLPSLLTFCKSMRALDHLTRNPGETLKCIQRFFSFDLFLGVRLNSKTKYVSLMAVGLRQSRHP